MVTKLLCIYKKTPGQKPSFKQFTAAFRELKGKKPSQLLPKKPTLLLQNLEQSNCGNCLLVKAKQTNDVLINLL